MSQTPLPPHWHMGQGMSEEEQSATDSSDHAETIVQITRQGIVAYKPVSSITINQTIERDKE